MDSTPLAGKLAVFGWPADESGYVAVAYGIDPYWNDQGRYVHEDWEERSYAWPADRERLLGDLREADLQRQDVYLCPMLRASRGRFQENGYKSWVAWVDLDNGNDKVPESLKPYLTLVSSGTPNHYHGYVRLTKPVEAYDLELLNRLLAKVCGGDSKWANNSVLRMPGTHNHKHEPPHKVKIQAILKPIALVDLLGLLRETDSEPQGQAVSRQLTKVSVDTSKLDPYVVSRLNEAPNGDRSGQASKFTRACLESGLSDDETFSLLLKHEPTREKYNGRHEEQAKTLIEKFRPKHEHIGKDCLQAKCPNAPDWLNAPDLKENKPTNPEMPSRIVWFSDVKAEPMEWYEEPWLPAVGLTGLAGPEDTGKSTYFIHEIVKLTTGSYGRPPIKVLYLAKEDDIGMIKARLKLAGAPANRVGYIAITVRLNDEDSYERDLNLKHDLAILRKHLEEDPEIKAVYLDPANSFLGIDEEKDGYSFIRTALEKLSLFARRQGILIRAMKHTKKFNGQHLPMVSMVYGSKAWTEVIRIFPILWPVSDKLRETLGMDIDDPTNVVLLRGKNNYAPKGLDAKGFYIDSDGPVNVDGHTFTRVTYMTYTKDHTLTNDDMEEKLAETKKETKQRQGEENATDGWIRDYFRNRGKVPRKEVMKAYLEAGIGTDKTLKNRANKVGIISEPIPGTNREVYWSLPMEL